MYHPYLDGVYRTEMGLQKLGSVGENGQVDTYYFQRDHELDDFVAAKKAAADQDAKRCFYLAGNEDSQLIEQVYDFMCDRLRKEWDVEIAQSGGIDGLQSLAYEIQEDFAIVQRQGDEDHLAVAAIALPAGWDPASYIGRSWRQIHEHIPGMEKLSARPEQIVKTMTDQGPYKRFVWGLQFDHVLDRNPRRYQPVRFNGKDFWLRVERQVLHPFSEHQASLFLIRTYLTHGDGICSDSKKRLALKEALLSMSAAGREYKGVAQGFDELIGFLSRTSHA